MPSRALWLFAALGASFAAGQAQNSSTFNPLEHSGPNSGYWVSGFPTPFDPAPPQGCNVTRATYMIRHANIYASDFDFSSYLLPFAERLGNASVDWSRTQSLGFLAGWQLPVDETTQEKVTDSGEAHARELGRNLSSTYSNLRKPSEIWVSSAERTTVSGEEFANGYTGGNSTTITVVSEGEEEGADSLSPYEACPAYSGSQGSEQEKDFVTKYTMPIIARFNSQVMQVGGSLNGTAFNFTAEDIVAMQLLCGYETNIKGESPFCSPSVFAQDEWISFAYAQDLQYFYAAIGYVSDISGSIGTPWVNASAELLFADNSTEDIYVSFVHREMPPAVFVALGLFNNSAYSGANNLNATMPTDTINPGRLWQTSKFLTYLTNIGIEKLSCNSFGYSAGEYYRVQTSGTPQALVGCNDGPGTSCSRSTFQSWLSARQAMFPGFSEACQTDYSNTTDTLSIYSS